LKVSKADFDAVCSQAWERYERSREWLADRYGFPSRVPEDRSQWRRYSMSAFRDVEEKARGTLIVGAGEPLALPEIIALDLADEGREWIDGLRAKDGSWVNWSSADEASFRVQLGDLDFHVNPVFEPTWLGGESSPGSREVRELIQPKEKFLAEFSLFATKEPISPADARQMLERVFENLDRHLGLPLVTARTKRVWPLPQKAVTHGWATAEGFFCEDPEDPSLSVSIAIRRPSFGRRNSGLAATLFDEMMKRHLVENARIA
jgi:hypothetical protein